MFPYYPNQQVIKVNGENGARAYQMPANSSVILLDESAPLIWLKTTDGAGYPSLSAYDIKPHAVEKNPDLKDIVDRITRLEGLIVEQSNNASIKRKSNGASDGN